MRLLLLNDFIITWTCQYSEVITFREFVFELCEYFARRGHQSILIYLSSIQSLYQADTTTNCVQYPSQTKTMLTEIKARFLFLIPNAPNFSSFLVT